MSHNAIRIVAAGIAITAVALISLATERPATPTDTFDPSVPPAWTVLHDNDGRVAGNVEDKTY
jgi:hypothetical protein